MSTAQADTEKLLREISGFGLVSLVLNGLIGAGIFALPGPVFRVAGTFSPFMFIICGVLISSVVIAFAKAASYFQGTGGPILYAQKAFGSLIGFQTGWLLYLGRVTALAANSNALVTYGGNLWGGMTEGSGRTFAILCVFLFFTVTNTIGVRRGIGTTNLLTILKLVPLLLFIGIGISYIKPEPFFEITPPSYGTFAETLLLVIYAFVGFEGAVVPAGESRDPRRDIPRALLLTVVLTTLLYFLVQAVCVAVLPGLEQSKAPIADVAKAMLGAPGTWFMTLAAFLSIAGNISAIMVAAPRMTYAMARAKTLPVWFGSVNERFKTPALSIVFLGILGFGLAVSGTFVWLAIMSSLTRMLGYGVCIAALPRIKSKFSSSSHVFRLRGEFFIFGFGLLLCLWLALQADMKSWIMTVIFILIGSMLYFVSHRPDFDKSVN